MKLNLKNIRFRTKLISGFTIISMLLLTVIFVSFSNSRKIIDSTFWITHTQQVLTDLGDIESRLIDLETGQRGFIITGKQEYLEPYEASLKRIDSDISHLHLLTLDNPSQTKRINTLDSLVALKLDELQRTIQLRKQENGFALAKEIVLTDEGKIIMDIIRDQISEIKNEELRLLTLRSQTPVLLKKRTTVLLIGLLVLSILFSIGISIITLRSIIRPINTLRKGTVIVGQGNLDHKLGISTKDEIGQLSQSFESMLVKLKSTLASKANLEKEIESRKQVEKKLLEIKNDLEISECQLIESNLTKDKFFSIIAHDLKTPFNSMLGFSNLLCEDFDKLSTKEQRNYIEIIHLSIKNTYELLNNLLIWSQTQNGSIDFKPEDENLFLRVKSVIDLMKESARKKFITIKTEVPQQIIIYADKNMLSTIMRNLLSNAIKFTKEGGEICILATLQKGENGSSELKMTVRDDGVGIPADVQPKLFNIAKNISTKGTANEEGTGLGLHICKEFVERHAGKIGVVSVPGKGSSFYFTIPKAKVFTV